MATKVSIGQRFLKTHAPLIILVTFTSHRCQLILKFQCRKNKRQEDADIQDRMQKQKKSLFLMIIRRTILADSRHLVYNSKVINLSKWKKEETPVTIPRLFLLIWLWKIAFQKHKRRLHFWILCLNLWKSTQVSIKTVTTIWAMTLRSLLFLKW